MLLTMESFRERTVTGDRDRHRLSMANASNVATSRGADRRLDGPWNLEDEPETRQVLAGGAPAMRADGRAAVVTAATCRAVTADRAGASQCRRMGWFALRERNGAVTQPLCSTHLRRLVAMGGPVLA